MGDRTVQKRKYIVEKAKSVFGKNGYRAVTMKDIVDVCARSAAEGCICILPVQERFLKRYSRRNMQEGLPFLRQSRQRGRHRENSFFYTLMSRKDHFEEKDNLTAATYEYLFENNFTAKNNPVKKSSLRRGGGSAGTSDSRGRRAGVDGL